MKTHWLGLLAGLCAVGPLLAADTHKAVVNFDHWQSYADIKDSSEPSDRGEQAILERLRQAIVSDAATLVPAGDVLTVNFEDIHLAGAFEPWRGPQWDEIRVVKDIYPPHLKFTWSVTDAAGKVVKQGAEDITDTSFQMRITIDQDDPLRYEKQILKDWLRGAMAGLKTA